MNEWSIRMAERLRKQQSDKANDSALFLEQQRIKKEVGPLLWGQVVSEVTNNCSHLNAEIGQDVVAVEATPSSKLIVSARTPAGSKQLRAEFNHDTFILSWSVNNKSGKYEVSIGSDRKPSFYPMTIEGQSMINWIPSSSKSITEEMLDALLS
jgi:hypothetical protein